MGKQQVWSVTACVFLFLSLSSQIHCSKEADLIEKLPGQPTVNFKQYGGYVAVDEKAERFFYYYLVEAIEAKDSAPLVIWFNGGPGSSSLSGSFTEHGPFRVHSDGKTLYRNPYSWNNKANVLYLETPLGVGFSYSNTSIELEKQGDKSTADYNYAFLVKWLERFPEYKGREFYVAGQSYAGHYAPQFAQTIVHNQRNKEAVINLRGLFIGNPGLVRPMEETGGNAYLKTHGVLTQEIMDNQDRLCRGEGFNFSLCEPAYDKIQEPTNYIDRYSIYEDKCFNGTLTSKPNKLTTIMKSVPCASVFLTAYLNIPTVQEAMHANTTKIPYPWATSSDLVIYSWSEDELAVSQLPTLQELIGEGIRIWIFSGDADSIVPATATIKVLKTMNLTVEKSWRPWFSGEQLGGYTEIYKENFTYATVRGAGHSVPADQPIRALNLFTNFLRNTPLPDTI